MLFKLKNHKSGLRNSRSRSIYSCYSNTRPTAGNEEDHDGESAEDAALARQAAERHKAAPTTAAEKLGVAVKSRTLHSGGSHLGGHEGLATRYRTATL